MKKVLISFSFILGLISVTIAQNHSFGISAGIGKGFIARQALEGGPSLNLNTGFSLGFQYDRKLATKLHIATGLHWYNGSVSVTPNFYPGVDMTPKKNDLELIYIPGFFKFDLSKYFFIQGGPIVDIDITRNKSITNQSGVGAGAGIGTEFSVAEKLSIQVNPYINLHGLIMMQKENYPARVFDSGIKVSLMFQK